VIPTGSSTYPITVIASYTECVPQADPPPGMHSCLPDGLPPLPPGEYRLDLQAQSKPMPAFDPITIAVV
jgi:hypothetical protein